MQSRLRVGSMGNRVRVLSASASIPNCTLSSSLKAVSSCDEVLVSLSDYSSLTQH